ncbi:MAG: hypothetical protein LBS62_07050, partial [Clostridiales bacterium]|nr:hypothetical protein [Clostridiales bacterium]
MPENIVKSEITAPVPAGADGTGQQAAFHLLPTGDISRLMCGPIMINQLPGNNVDDMAQNIYLRLYAPAAGPPSADGSPSAVYPLMGKCSGAALYVSDTQFAYAGKAGPVNYKLYVTPLGNMWFYDIFLNASNGEQTLDLIYGQDVGLASPGHIQSNEAYNSQYIGHSVFDTEYGRAVCSRQNQRQDTGFPFLQQGGLRPGARGGVRAWSTDGYPFFGLSYKFTNEIEELRRDKLNSRLYQYEFAYVALQSGKLRFSDTEQFTFYGAFLPDAPVSRLLDPETIAKAHRSLEFMDLQGCRPRPAFREKIKVSRTLASLPISPEEVRSRYSVRKHEELDNGSLLSFFTETDEHVVLAEKERHTERSHGHIIITGRNQDAGENTLASTSYIYGVFQSQAVLGNTSFNQLFSNTRNGLNVMKFSGQRLMLKQDGEYRLLTMPAVYEMGFNYAKWLYLLGNGDTLTIISRVALDRPALLLEARSQRGHAYDFLLLARLAPDIAVEPEQGAVRARFREGTLAAETYPEMAYRMTLDRDFALWDDSAFAGEPALALEINGADSFVFSVFAAVDGKPDKAPPGDFAEEAGAYRQWLHGDIGGLRLSPGGGPEGLEKLNTAAMWFGHNARIHYASPHGLEQYGGAAWGTRDVCQGPLEYFITGQQFDIAAEILRKVFSRQYADDGSWPQWFMFDRYCGIQQAESHGDIIVWPLKALAHYLLATGGASFLDTLVPYTERGGGFTRKAESVFQHVLRALENIQTNFIEGTFLSRYGNGDWDDTLQPADVSMRENMASGWTAALTYQAFNELSEATAGYDAGFSRRL